MMWWRTELDGGFDDKVAATPDAFKCPITQERFFDPVVAADGHTYERIAIERWLSGRHYCSLKGATIVALAANRAASADSRVETKLCAAKGNR